MKTSRRSRKGLPSPFEVLLYLLAVLAFCVINWKLLITDNTPPAPPAKPFETMIVEHMLEDLDPVMKQESQAHDPGALDLGVSNEHRLKLETWMISPEAFFRIDTDDEPTLEDWMIDLSTWFTD